MSDKPRQDDTPTVQVSPGPDGTVTITINYNRLMSMGASLSPHDARLIAASLIRHADQQESKR